MSRVGILMMVGAASSSSSIMQTSVIVLQPEIAKAPQCNSSSTVSTAAAAHSCCSDCLGVGDASYNWMLSCMWWFSLLSLPVGGFLMDKLGNWMLLVFSALVTAGMACIALASALHSSAARLALLNIGAAVSGCGLLTNFAARDRIVGVWFKDTKYLGLAFGTVLFLTRIFSLPGFFVLQPLHNRVGLQWTLGVCTLACFIALLCSLGAVAMDARVAKRQGIQEELRQEQAALAVYSLVSQAPCEYWLLVVVYATFNAAFYSYHDNATQFLHEYFGFTKTAAANLNSLLHFASIAAAPLFGLALDKLGRISQLLTFGTTFMIAGLAPLLIVGRGLHPAVGNTLVGLAKSFVNPSILSGITVTVSRANFGTASALGLCLMSLASSAMFLIVGAVLGNDHSLPIAQKRQRWIAALLIITAMTVIATAIAAVLCAVSCIRKNELVQKASSKQNYETIGENDSSSRQSG